MDKKTNLRALTECSIMIALSTVLSIVKLFEMPYGGSITLASMLPIAIIAYRHGTKLGFTSALAVSLIQMLLGMKNFSYFSTWRSFVVLAVLDYVVAFGVFGISGMFKKKLKKQSTALTVGIILASLLRYLCHVISGATIWAGLSIPTEAALVYSFSYNATYMIPETVILTVLTVYVASVLDLSAAVPTRMRSEKVSKVSICTSICAGAVAAGGLIADIVLIFSKLQNAESGEFDITSLGAVNWLAVIIITALTAIISLTLALIAKKYAREN
ncbi:MAG: energy-coupled thiamine transporter ThiT [Clostridia bacterium]|nr:energy-coupled thiamine transporter ThiT [Clostridia bacterium]